MNKADDLLDKHFTIDTYKDYEIFYKLLLKHDPNATWLSSRSFDDNKHKNYFPSRVSLTTRSGNYKLTSDITNTKITFEEAINILEDKDKQTNKSYPGKAYEQARVMPGDKARWTDAGPQDIIIIEPENDDADRYVYFQWTEDSGSRTAGNTDGGQPEFVQAIDNYTSAKATIAEDTSDIYCTCGGLSKLQRFDTFQYELCLSCRKEVK